MASAATAFIPACPASPRLPSRPTMRAHSHSSGTRVIANAAAVRIAPPFFPRVHLRPRCATTAFAPPRRARLRQPSRRDGDARCEASDERESAAPDVTPAPAPADSGDAASSPSHSSSFTWRSFRSVRVVMSLLSLTGCVETLYLTFNKLFSSPGAICATQGCLDVLSGPFSVFLGIPLSLLGSLSYAVFAFLCIWPLTSEDRNVDTPDNDSNSATDPAAVLTADELYRQRDAATRPLLLAVATAQFTFTLYLVAVLRWVLHSMCPYCVLSATLATSLFLLTAVLGERAVPRLRTAIPIFIASATFAGMLSAASFASAYPIHKAFTPTTIQTPPAITESSSAEAMGIARRLHAKNARMFGAYWCSHCYDQKQRFGKQAFGMLPYVECDPHGVNAEEKLCRQKRIQGYPTWEINGELFPGEIDISELDRLSHIAGVPAAMDDKTTTKAAELAQPTTTPSKLTSSE